MGLLAPLLNRHGFSQVNKRVTALHLWPRDRSVTLVLAYGSDSSVEKESESVIHKALPDLTIQSQIKELYNNIVCSLDARN